MGRCFYSTGEGALAGVTCGTSLLLTQTGAAITRSAIDWKGGEGIKVAGLKGKHGKSLTDASLDLVGEALLFGFNEMSGVGGITFANTDEAFFMGLLEGSIGGLSRYGLNEGKNKLKELIK